MSAAVRSGFLFGFWGGFQERFGVCWVRPPARAALTHVAAIMNAGFNLLAGSVQCPAEKDAARFGLLFQVGCS
jgi:hypothetical protein